MSFYKETIAILEQNNKSLDDVAWVGTEFVEIPIQNFVELADFDYDDGFGAQKVASDLLIVGQDFWMKRVEHDGAERWQYHTMPQRPTVKKTATALHVADQFVGWKTLSDLNDF